MNQPSNHRQVRLDLQLRVECPSQPGKLWEIFQTIKDHGGLINGHLIYRAANQLIALLLCDRPAEAAMALQSSGYSVETETVVTVRTESQPGVMAHLLRVLEMANVEIIFSHSTVQADALLVVLQTADNPRAEDALKNYLLLADEGAKP